MERAWEIGIHAFPKVWEILFHQIPNLWFTREMNRSSHQDPIALEKTTIPILWEKPGKVVPTLLPKRGCFFFIRFLSYGMLHHTVNAWSFPSISHSIKKYSKTHPLGTAWELVSTLFQNYGWFSSIRFPSCGMLYCMGNAWLFQSISHSMGKCSKAHPIGEILNIDTNTFSQSMTFPFHKVFTLWYYEMFWFSHEFLITWENAAKSILWQEPGISILLSIYLSFCSNKFPLLYTTFNGWYMCFHTNFL